MIEQLLSFISASILLTLAPGPDILYVMTQSISNGKRAGLWTALGLVSGILIHTSFVAFGISALIKQSPLIFTFIKVVGACYLVFLAIQVYRSPGKITFADNKLPKKKTLQLLRRGFLMNVINPKVTLFFLALLPGFLWDSDHHTVVQFYLLGLVFIVQAFLIFSAVALLAGRLSHVLKRNRNTAGLFKWVQILVFVGIAIFILL